MSKYNSKSSKEIDDEFERFILKESMTSSESSLDTRALASLEDKLNSGRGKNWASQFRGDEDDDSIGLLGTGKKFLKSATLETALNPGARNRQTAKEQSEYLDLSLSKDSLDQGNGKTSLHPGRDTLEEIADKEKFFSEIEKNMSHVPDYGRLYRDLDSSHVGSLPQTASHLHEQSSLNHKNDSSDEEEADDKNSVINQEQSNAKPVSMLSQVALIESLDSTYEKKQVGSQDPPTMHTIAEGTGEQTARLDNFDDSSYGFQKTLNNSTPMSHIGDNNEENEEESDNKITDDTTTKGVTGKTVTGFTDTCHDIEALQKELRKVGCLETFDSSNNFTFEETSALGEFADTRNKESTATTVGGTGKTTSITAGDRAATLSELNNRHLALGTNSNDTANRFQPSKRRSKPQQAFNAAHPQQLSVRFNEETQEISHSSEGLDEVDSWIKEEKNFVKRPKSVERKISESKSIAGSAKGSKSAGDVGTRQSGDKYSNVKSSGYGYRSPAAKISAAKSVWSPDLRHSKGVKSGRNFATYQSSPNIREGGGHSQVLAGNHLSDSSDPFQLRKSLSDLVMSPSEKPSMSSSLKGPESESQFWNERYKTEVMRVAKLQAASSAMEKEHFAEVSKLKSDYEQKILNLQQENFALSAKIDSECESRMKRLAEVKQNDDIPKEQLAQLEAEMQQQDKLLAGYQTENERLYEEMKKLRAVGKAAEEKMFRENQKLKVALANLSEELSSKDSQLKHMKDSSSASAVPGAARIAHLETELKQAKVSENDHRAEVEEANKAKDEMERKMAKEIKELKEELAEALSQHSLDAKEVEERYRKELNGQKKKLKWYAENQQLLDKDVMTLQQKDNEIKELRTRLQELQLDTGQNIKAMKTEKKQRSADSKKIQDLERQIKEMEAILKKRHPNSLPVLMWAASNDPNGGAAKPPSVEYLEGRIKKLEAQLDEQDELGKRSARALEQKYNQAVLQYETRIKQLESQVAKYQHEFELSIHPHTTLLALQRELDSVRERNRKQLAEQEQTIAALTKELTAIRRKEPDALNKSGAGEKSFGNNGEKIDEVQQKFDDQRLLEIIQKLKNDNQSLAGDLRGMAERLAEATSVVPADKKKQIKITTTGGKTFKRKRLNGQDANGLLLPIHMDAPVLQKDYNPEAFAGQHASDLFSENCALKSKVEALMLEVEQQRVMLQKMTAEQEANERCHQEEMEERVSGLKEAHFVELQKLAAVHAVEHSGSHIAELQNRTSAQEVVIQHLKEQLAQSLVENKHISILQSSKLSLEAEVKQLQQDLQEARSSHTPQMRHFEMLQEKIHVMETRHQQREQQLEQLLRQNQLSVAEEVSEEAAKWKKIVELKTKEIDRFRAELDSILDILRMLQRQGIVIPFTERTAAYSNNESLNGFSNHQMQ